MVPLQAKPALLYTATQPATLLNDLVIAVNKISSSMSVNLTLIPPDLSHFNLWAYALGSEK